MLDARQRNRASSAGSPRMLTGPGRRIRLFALLAVLIPLFVGLQYLVQESVPQIEVRFIAPDAQATGSGQVSGERVVERVVYVPVEKTETAPMSVPAPGLPQAAGRSAEVPRVSGLDSASAVPPMQAAPEQSPIERAPLDLASSIDPAQEPMAHIGVV